MKKLSFIFFLFTCIFTFFAEISFAQGMVHDGRNGNWKSPAEYRRVTKQRIKDNVKHATFEMFVNSDSMTETEALYEIFVNQNTPASKINNAAAFLVADLTSIRNAEIGIKKSDEILAKRKFKKTIYNEPFEGTLFQYYVAVGDMQRSLFFMEKAKREGVDYLKEIAQIAHLVRYTAGFKSVLEKADVEDLRRAHASRFAKESHCKVLLEIAEAQAKEPTKSEYVIECIEGVCRKVYRKAKSVF
ncbi:hypothetical protein Dip510_000013 [Elusimicrobium posterum]|uniref:hypothetical protein n=1 Tax=Elusimicrobium posterum TaxID=3116653 RepID=UPI003C718865